MGKRYTWIAHPLIAVPYKPRNTRGEKNMNIWVKQLTLWSLTILKGVGTAPLSSKRCILYIYSTNIGTQYFKYGIYSPFFPLQKCSLFHNSNVFGSRIIHILYTGVLKLKK